MVEKRSVERSLLLHSIHREHLSTREGPISVLGATAKVEFCERNLMELHIWTVHTFCYQLKDIKIFPFQYRKQWVSAQDAL